MLEGIGDILKAIGPGALIPAALFGLFAKADDYVSEGFRKWLSGYLRQLNAPTSTDTPWTGFVQLFDSLFGDNWLSRQFVFRSAVASLLAVATVTVCVYVVVGTLPEHRLFSDPVLLLVIVSLNVLPDYVSLVQTRYLLGRVVQGKLNLFLAVVVDAIATAVIFVLLGSLCLGIGLALIQENSPALSAGLIIGTVIGHALPFIEPPSVFGRVEDPYFSVFVYSTYFTSAWLWVYAGGIVVIRALARSGTILKVAKFVLPIDAKPLRAIGTAAFIPPIIISGLVSWLVP